MLFRKKSKVAETPAAPALVPIAVTGEPDLRGLGRLLWAKKVKILAITLLAAAAAFAVVNAITPRYRSESRLLLEARENVFLRAEADKNGGDRTTIDTEAVTSQIQLVLSRDLAREVIKNEKLADNPEFDSALRGPSTLKVVLSLFGIGRDPAGMTKEERTLDSYYDRLNVFAVEKSRVIGVDFLSANPDLAARVANSVAETYLKMQQTARQDQTRAAGDWLAGEIANLRTKVADAEAKVEAYRSKTNLFVGANNTSLPTQQLTEINSQIAAARGQKADLEARARQLREVIRSGKPIESSDIANSESMRRLIEQRNALRSQLAEQSTTLLDRHPRIKELKAQIAEVEGAIRAEGGRLAAQLDNDAKVAGDRLETLTASLNTVKKQASQTNGQDVQLRALEREAKTERDLLESLSRQIPRGDRTRQHQCRAAGGAHHFARQPGDQAGLSEEIADRADRGLRGLCVVGGLHRDRSAAGNAVAVFRLPLCAAADGRAHDARRFAVHDAGRFACRGNARRADGGEYGRAYRAEHAPGR